MKTRISLTLSFAIFMVILPLSAAKYYLYTGSTNPWGTKGDGTVTQVTNISTTLNGYATNDVVWIAAGTYTISAAIAPKAGMQIYGSFVGSESALTDRTVFDADGNGVVELWEFNYPTVINGTGFSGTSVAYSIFNSNTAAYTLNGVSLDGHNTSNTNGGAIYTNANSTISNCIIRNINHTGTGGGAGIYSNANGGATITNCLIENCVTTASGGAVFANRKVTVKQCVIRNNYASTVGTASKGGGIYLHSTSDASNTSYLINNAIYNNTAHQGGGIALADADATGPLNIVNNTIVNNVGCPTTGGSTGGIIGMRIGIASPSTLQKYYNNVIYNNFENGTTSVKNIRTTLTSGAIDLQFSAYNGGTQMESGAAFGTIGNINNLSTPYFVQPSTTKGYTATMPNDVKIANFTLSSNSPLRDVGMSSSDIPTVDIINNVRPNGTLNDIGAYEWSSANTSVLSYPTNGATLTQNFDILTTLGTKTLYTNTTGSAVATTLGPWNLAESTIYNKSELTGWQLYKTGGSLAAAGTVQVGYGAGGNGTVNFYYLGNANTDGADQSLGGNFGAALSGGFGVVLQNNTGNDLTSFSLTYTGEQWKNVSSAQTLSFKYSIGNASSIKDISNGTFTSVSQLNFVTPTVSGGTSALDGNSSANRTTKTYTVSGISWPNGQRLALRWDATSGQMAIDDVSFTTAIPTISVSTNSLTGFSTTYGAGVSGEQPFTVGGTNMLGSITVNPPTDYEISTTSGSGFVSTPITVGSAGTISATTIYARLKSGLSAGSYNNENIVVSGTGGVTVQNVSCSGVVSQKELTISTATIASKVYDGSATSGTVTPGTLSGFVSGETVTVNTAVGTYPDANVGTGKTATIVYTLANGTNGGLALNYSLSNGTATGDITAATVTPAGDNLNNSGLTDNQLANTNLTISSGEFIINATKTVRSLTIAPGAKLTHSSGTLSATNGITLESDATGTATIMDSFTEPTITATVKQYVTAGRNWYMSAPLNNTADYSILNKGASVAEYNEVTGLWPTVSSGTLTRGKGYVQAASASQGTTGTVSFNGTTNSGNVAVTLTNTLAGGKGYNLVGNPYPSYLSWSAVAADNAAANMPTGTMWYRTISYNGKSAWAPSTAYSLNDIVYNGTRFYKVTTAGTSAASGGPTGGLTGITDGSVVWNYEGSIYLFATISASGVASPATVSNLVPPMQAFWVKSTGGTLTFKNAMRSHNTGGANALKAPKNAANDIKLIRLNVTNGASADEAVIYASTDASNAFDTYDAPKYFNVNGSNQPEIYTQVGSEKLVINAMSQLNQGTEIPLGFATEKGNNFTISASEFRNFGLDQKVMLKDKQTSSEFDLTNGQSYPFSSGAVNNADRFSLIFRTTGTTTGINNTEKGMAHVFVNAANQITIVAPLKSNYAINNAVGQLIENGVTTANLNTVNHKLQTGVYVVKIGNQSTRVIIK